MAPLGRGQVAAPPQIRPGQMMGPPPGMMQGLPPGMPPGVPPGMPPANLGRGAPMPPMRTPPMMRGPAPATRGNNF